jgi:hypothetical protein
MSRVSNEVYDQSAFFVVIGKIGSKSILKARSAAEAERAKFRRRRNSGYAPYRIVNTSNAASHNIHGRGSRPRA